MDRDKRTAAIVEYCEDFHNGTYKPTAFDISEAFKSGTDWLMQQPLSERLTDEEKEEIRRLYNKAQKDRYDNSVEGAIKSTVSAVVMSCLTEIFGADLFNQPTAI